jgi:hypothetical protein
MNWRRGLLLAGIHLAVAIALILSLEAKDAEALRLREQANVEADREAAARTQMPTPTPSYADSAQPNSGEMFRFDPDPCSMMVHYPAQVTVEVSAAYPAVAVTGWRMYCAASWSLSKRLGSEPFWLPTTADEAAADRARRKVDKWFVVVLVLQWFLIGGFPLLRPKAWWAEPGAFITVCTVIGGAFALIPALYGLALLAALVALVAWFWWFGLLVWRLTQGAWRLIRHVARFRPAARGVARP